MYVYIHWLVCVCFCLCVCFCASGHIMWLVPKRFLHLIGSLDLLFKTWLANQWVCCIWVMHVCVIECLLPCICTGSPFTRASNSRADPSSETCLLPDSASYYARTYSTSISAPRSPSSFRSSAWGHLVVPQTHTSIAMSRIYLLWPVSWNQMLSVPCRRPFSLYFDQFHKRLKAPSSVRTPQWLG